MRDDIDDETIEIIICTAYYAMTSPSFRPQIHSALGLKPSDMQRAIDLIGNSINGDTQNDDFLSTVTSRIRKFFNTGGMK